MLRLFSYSTVLFESHPHADLLNDEVSSETPFQLG